MPRTIPRVVLAAKTKQGRKDQRKGIRLRDFTVTNRTRERYERAVGKILPFLEAQPDLQDLDGIVGDYIELEWARGEAVNDIADCLSGLHFFWPQIKGLLRQSWRLFRSWRLVEAPQRAPPLTVWLAKAVVARALECDQLAFATLFALGFNCLLRTGELLALQFKDFEISRECGVVSLFSSKSGLRTGTEEAVSIRDPLVLDLIRTLAAGVDFSDVITLAQLRRFEAQKTTEGLILTVRDEGSPAWQFAQFLRNPDCTDSVYVGFIRFIEISLTVP
eukprot:s38_g25.t1